MSAKSRFPGTAQRKWNGDIVFVKGTIIFESPRVQYVQPKAKYLGFWKGGIVHLIGDSYLYICENCRKSICQFQLPSLAAIRARGIDFLQASSSPHCPDCFTPLSKVAVGDKVLLHYRSAPMEADAVGNVTVQGWGGWFAERKEW